MRIIITPMSENSQQPYLCGLAASLRAHGHHVRPLQTRHLMVGKADVVIVNWPENAAGSSRTFLATANTLAYVVSVLGRRLAHQRLVLIWHNSEPHEMVRPRLQRLLSRATAHLADAIIFLSRHTYDEYLSGDRRPSRTSLCVIPIGVDASTPASKFAAEAHGNAAPTALWFGIVRPYKGLSELLRAHEALPPGAMQLKVLANDSYASPDVPYLRRRLSASNVRGVVGTFSDEALGEALATADVAVFPFQRIDNSSSVFTALGARCPVVLPISPFSTELQAAAGDCVETYSPPLTPQILHDKVSKLTEQRRAGTLTWNWLEGYSWTRIGEQWQQLLRSWAPSPADDF